MASACWSSPTARCCPPSWSVLARRLRRPSWLDATAWLERLQEQLADYFAGRRETFDLPLVAPGTPFQERVWATLRQIPTGGTLSYEALADGAGGPAPSARGHGQRRQPDRGRDPCHRVVRKSGEIGNYGGGSWRKAWLLDHERRMAEALAPDTRRLLEGDVGPHGVIAAVDVDHLAGGHRRPVGEQEAAHLPDRGRIGQRQPNGARFSQPPEIWSKPGMLLPAMVRIGPAETVLTRIPCGPRSRAR